MLDQCSKNIMCMSQVLLQILCSFYFTYKEMLANTMHVQCQCLLTGCMYSVNVSSQDAHVQCQCLLTRCMQQCQCLLTRCMQQCQCLLTGCMQQLAD
jgi:hypothetical protein